MATHQLHYSYLLMEKYEELERARYKIRCLLRDKKDADAQFEELKDENTVLNDEKAKCIAVNRDLKRQNRRLQRQLNAKEWEISQLREEVVKAEGFNNSLDKELKAIKARFHTWFIEWKQDSEDQISLLKDKCSKLEMELAEARDSNEDLDQQITSLILKTAFLEEEAQLVHSASVSKEQSMLAEVKTLKKVKNGLQRQLKQALNKPRVQPKEHGEMMQRQQMEQRMSKLDKANRSKTKQKRRKTGKVEATVELEEGTGYMQPKCAAEAAPSEVREKEVEDEAVAFSEPSQPYGVSVGTNKTTSPAEGDVHVECKESEDAAEPSQKNEVDTVVSMEPIMHDSEDLPSGSPEIMAPLQVAEMVVQATQESAGTTPPYTDWTADIPCRRSMSADPYLPQSRKRRRSIIRLTVAAKRRSVLINQATNTIANYKHHPAILRVPASLSEIRTKNRRIAELEADVRNLVEVHEKDGEDFMKVSVDFQETCEQFTPRHSDIDQLVISQLPQIVTCREYWCTIFQAVLGLSTTACSSHNWQSIFRYWLSGRGRGPPVWKTLLNALEASNIVELQRIANCLKARLHEFLPYSRLEDDGRCIACGQLLPQSIQEEEDLIFISQEESIATNIDGD